MYGAVRESGAESHERKTLAGGYNSVSIRAPLIIWLSDFSFRSITPAGRPSAMLQSGKDLSAEIERSRECQSASV